MRARTFASITIKRRNTKEIHVNTNARWFPCATLGAGHRLQSSDQPIPREEGISQRETLMLRSVPGRSPQRSETAQTHQDDRHDLWPWRANLVKTPLPNMCKSMCHLTPKHVSHANCILDDEDDDDTQISPSNSR